MTRAFRDQAVVLGGNKIGILTLPAGSKPSHAIGVIVLSTGTAHRVGMNRLSVMLSRVLAEAGYPVLRFDLSGIGDSDRRADGLPPLEAGLADIREAMDWFQNARGARQFVLVGHCMGANLAVVCGGVDGRVVGQVLMDTWIPPTHWFRVLRVVLSVARLARYALGLRRWRKIMNLRRHLSEFLQNRSSDVLADDLVNKEVARRESDFRAVLDDSYRRLAMRGAKTLAVFTSGLLRQYNYRRQMLDAFPNVPFDGNLRIEFFWGCDHDFSFEASRSRLFRMIKDWIQTTTFAEPMPCIRERGHVAITRADSIHIEI